MIVGNIHYKQASTEISAKLQECLDYAHAHNLSEMEPGSYPIRGEDLFVNIVSYETTEPEHRFWEAHKAYLDLHLLLAGSERIDVNFLDNMELKSYIAKDDFLPAAGARKASVLLEAGDYLVCYPEDVHMTALYEGHSEKIKKAIFKIKI